MADADILRFLVTTRVGVVTLIVELQSYGHDQHLEERVAAASTGRSRTSRTSLGRSRRGAHGVGLGAPLDADRRLLPAAGR
jgi:hypothetical protein